MKREICLIGLCMLLTGCGAQANSNQADSDADQTANLRTVLENASVDFAKIKSESPYENLHFDNAVLKIPTAAGDLYALHITRSKMPQDKALDLFLDTLSQTFSPEAAADKDNLFFGSQAVPPTPNGFTLAYPQIYRSNYEDKIRSNALDCDLFLYQTDTDGAHDSDCYFMLGTEGGMKMNRGTCTRSVEKKRALAGWMPRDNFEVSAWYTPDSADSFPLADGSCRVCDAAQYCQQYLSSDVFPAQMRGTKWQTKSVGIMQTDPAHSAFYLTLTREYGGIPFDSLHTEGTFSDFSNGNDYLFDGSEAMMTASNEIEYYFLMNGADSVIPAEQPAKKVLSLQSAAKAVSETMTTAFAFDVHEISLVYCNRVISDTESEVRAHWCFVCYNPNDERTYRVYADAETGESFYYAY
ncbi:MAG: hypothetical protein IJ060_08220 [Oscillospiraceae bacterium]|nr:hypothetical protein [Oscillospiraceae bacterium]